MVQAKATINSYEDAENFLGDKDEKKIAANTYVVRWNDTIMIRLYATDIVVYYPDGQVQLRHNGHCTTTTAQRINQFCPKDWCVFRKQGVMYAQEIGRREAYEMPHLLTLSASLTS